MATEEELSEVVMMQGSALDVMSPSRAQEMEVDLTNGSFEDDQLLAAQQQSIQMYQMQQMQQMQGYPAQYKDDNESEEDEDEDENEDDEDFSDDEDFDDAPSKKKRKTGAASENKAEVANKNETQASHARVKSSATPVAPKTPPRGARDKKTVSPSPQNSGKRGRKGESKSPPVAQRGQQAKLKEEDYEDDEENDEEEEEDEDGEEYVEEGNDDEDEDEDGEEVDEEDGEEVDEEDVEVVQPDKAPVKSLPSATQIVATSQMSEESASDNEHTNTHTKAAADLREIPESKDDGSEGESEDEEEEEEKASKRKPASTKKTNRKAQDKDVTANQNAKDDNADEEDNNEDDDEEDDEEEEEEEEEEQTAEPENPLQGEIDSLDAASRKIYDYLKRTNRPFSPLDIQRALTGLTKLQVTKSLSKLVDLGIAHVNEKKVHWLEQTIFGSTDPSAISKTKARLEKRSESAQKPKRKLTALKRDIADLRTEPADDEVDAEIAKLRATLREHKTELAERNAGPSGKGETESRMANLRARAEVGQEVLECEFKFYKEAWRSRREVVQNFVQDILDNMAKKVKIDKFYDELGIESDAAFNLNIKDVRMRD